MTSSAATSAPLPNTSLTSQDPLAELSPLLEDFYSKSWGKAWPTVTKALYKPDLPPPEEESLALDAVMENDEDDIVLVARRHEYLCFEELGLFKNGLISSGVPPPSVLVRLEGYDTLLKLVEEGFAKGRNGFVVTGQSGIGSKLSSALHRVLTAS